MEILQLIFSNWELISLPLTGALGWFFTKRHFETRELKQADISIDSSSSDVVSKNLDLYQRMLDDVEERYQMKLSLRDIEIDNLEKENATLKIEVSNLSGKIDELVKQITRMDEQIKKNNG